MSLFITLEGPDGGGKSTQALRLVESLRGQGLDVLMTREPGGTAIGDQIRRVLTDLGNTPMHPRTELLLFSASRAQLCHEVIRPHLQAGGTVVSDRFYDSTFAYQGYGHRLDLEALRHITTFATGGLVPDLTLLLDLAAQDGLMRRKKHGEWNRLDAYDLAFHERVRQGFLALAAADPQRWVKVDAARPADEVHADIRRIVEAKLGERRHEQSEG
ncbi:MAG TPA: dTMP kinase [Anaerolineales bacterium]|nr:dTMP kinase [Anaerolineales bacterium]